MRAVIPPEYLAVDFDLRSRVDPASFIAAISGRLSAQDLGKHAGRHWIHLMLHRETRTPSDAILAFARLLGRLPPEAKRVLDRAAKEFDIGFEAGSNAPRPGEWVLSRRALDAATRLGATIRITVYASRESMEARQRSGRS